MTAYSGGEQIQNYLDPNRPDYGGIVLATSESGSALKRALVKLSADVAGAKEMADASEKAAKMGAAGIVDRANAGTFAAGIGALGQAAGGFMSAIPTGSFGATEGVNPTKVVNSFGGSASGQAGNDFFVDAAGVIRPNPT